MYICPNCGFDFEPTPEAIGKPKIMPSWCSPGKWRVLIWTAESDHRWIKDGFESKEAAEEFAATIIIRKK